MRRHPGLILALIICVAVLAGIFVYPARFGASWRPWRLGLDLVGGSHLVYQVDLSQVGDSDKNSVLNGLRDVIERNVIQRALINNGYSRTRTADSLGISRVTLYKKMKKYGLMTIPLDSEES